MKWLQTNKIKKQETFTVKCKRFLFFPLTIKFETRWLEFAEWEKTWHPTTGYDYAGWSKDKWLN